MTSTANDEEVTYSSNDTWCRPSATCWALKSASPLSAWPTSVSRNSTPNVRLSALARQKPYSCSLEPPLIAAPARGRSRRPRRRRAPRGTPGRSRGRLSRPLHLAVVRRVRAVLARRRGHPPAGVGAVEEDGVAGEAHLRTAAPDLDRPHAAAGQRQLRQ